MAPHARGPIFGIACDVRSRRVRRAIVEVLAAVRRHPRDWGRLRRRVRAIRNLPAEGGSDGTLGEWSVDVEEVQRLNAKQQAAFCTEGKGYLLRTPMEMGFHASGWIALSRRLGRLPWAHQLATVAHECGHVVTREREFERLRAVNGDAEWTSEMCANRYVFRWGFKEELRAQAPNLDVRHEAVLPGEMIWVHGEAYGVDWRFRLRRCPAADRPEQSSVPLMVYRPRRARQ